MVKSSSLNPESRRRAMLIATEFPAAFINVDVVITILLETKFQYFPDS